MPPGAKPNPFMAYPGPVLALTGTTLLVGSGAPAQRGMTVLIQSQRIQAVGKDGVGYDSAKLIDSAKGDVGIR